jgi:hypothetical protein
LVIVRSLGSVDRAAYLQRLLAVAFLLRLLAVVLLDATDAVTTLTLSKDSGKYHYVGMIIAERMSRGYFDWSSWIDNGWYQFVGLVYWIVGPHPIVVQLVNVTIGSATALVAYRLASEVYRDERIARISGFLVAVLPSFVYYSALLLKDTVAIFSVSLLVLGTVGVRKKLSLVNMTRIMVPLLILLAVRDYLFLACTTLTGISLIFSRGRSIPLTVARAAAILLLVGVLGQVLGLGFMGIGYARSTPYFDLDFINDTRSGMTTYGTGAIFEDGDSAGWGSDLWSNLRNGAAAVYYFFFSLDLRNIGSVRQAMALPEVLAFILLLPTMLNGVRWSWKRYRWASLPLLVFVGGLIVVYGAATTNMGAMYRWRMQVMPLLMVFIAVGLRVRPRRWLSTRLEGLSRLGCAIRGLGGYWICPTRWNGGSDHLES